jgi:hypothetical protein
MKRILVTALVAVALLVLVAVAASAGELTVNSILTAQQAGAPAEGIIAMVNNPANTITLMTGDLITLRQAGVPEDVISAIWARIPAPTPAPVPLQPDDARLVDFVRLTRSGTSEPIIVEQVERSNEAYNLSVNDLLYLKQNDAPESLIMALMATSAAAPARQVAPPAELVFDDMVLIRPGFWKKNRTGRLVLNGDTLTWQGDRYPEENFTFQTKGLEEVWYTCDAASSGNFCYQINFQIVKGDRYRFQDGSRESGSNVAVLKVMDALRTYYPRLNFGTPSVDG